jgi:hypothetical protein
MYVQLIFFEINLTDNLQEGRVEVESVGRRSVVVQFQEKVHILLYLVPFLVLLDMGFEVKSTKRVTK